MTRIKSPDAKRKKVIQIIISEQCNLNCIYCYEQTKANTSIPIDRVKSIIESSFHNNPEYDELEFDFHGGEISLHFPLLKQVCEWLWLKQWNKPYICFASTNGTLIHGEIQQWFWENRAKFWLGLSLDGTPEMHNTNRSNSFFLIDIVFFRNAWPMQTIKMTISPQTLPSLAKGIQYIHGLGFELTANLAYGVDWSVPTLVEEYKAQLHSLVSYYLNNPTIKPINLVSFSLIKIGASLILPEYVESTRWCGSGQEMICYDVDGRSYPCQFFVPSTYAKNGDKISTMIQFSDDILFDDQMCNSCSLRYACPTCYGSNYIERGDVKLRCKNLCRLHKLEAQATSYLYGMALSEKSKYPYLNDLSPQQEHLMITAINKIQKEIG